MGRSPLAKPADDHLNERGPDTESTLLPMLIAGLLMVIVGGVAIMVFV